MGADRWKYNFWRQRHERGADVIKIHGSTRSGWIAYKRGDALFLFGYEMGAKSAYGMSAECVRQLTPTARVLAKEEASPLLADLDQALKGIELFQ